MLEVEEKSPGVFDILIQGEQRGTTATMEGRALTALIRARS